MPDDSRQTAWLERIGDRLPTIYLVLALVLTGLLAWMTAPFFGPDEPNQACRAISLSHGVLIPQLGTSEGGAQIDAGAYAAMDGVNDLRMAWERRSPDFHDRHFGPLTVDAQRPLGSIRWARRTVFVPFGNTAVYPPVLYLPAMLGWRIGEAADLTIFNSLRLARLFSALTAIALGWLALRIAGSSRWRLLPFLLLPSTLFLNASCSQDAVLLSVAALVVAMLSRALAAQRAFTNTELAVMAVLLALCGSARPPNIALALVLFLPAIELTGATWRRFLAPAAAFGTVMAMCAAWMYTAAPLGLQWSDEADPELQGIFLRAHPLAAVAAVVKGTVAAGGDFFHRGLYVVGWNDLLPHHGIAAILTVCLAVIALTAPSFPLRTWRGRVLLALAVAGPLLGISLAEYIIWTPPGGHTVFGIQPRYWLPMMPLATMLAHGMRKPRWLIGASALLALVACTLPWMAAHAFYRDGVVRVFLLNLHD